MRWVGAEGDLAVGVVATVNHLHQVLNLARSIRAAWATQPAILVAVADERGGPRPGFEDGLVEFVDAAALGIENYGWLALKYDPTELCCAIKPYLVRHALERGHSRVVYCDADLHFFANPRAFLELGERHDFVVTPHTLAPFPPSEAWLRPTLGDLSGAGLLNAGLFSVRASDAAYGFLERWSSLVASPGAFLTDLGGQHEQNFFNWVLAFVDDVAICRDRTINVAYWNLHERPLRWSALDGGPEDAWTVDGKPLTCFHYSGFAWETGRLSTHDQRHKPSLDVNLHALCRFYADRLEEAEREHYALEPYAFASVDDETLTLEVRHALKRSEQLATPIVSSWPEDARAPLRRLHGILGPSHVVPQYLDRVLADRPDLRALNADDVIFPERFLAWTASWFDREYEHGWLFERHCEFAWDRGAVDRIAEALLRLDPELTPARACDLAIHDRRRALELVEGRAELGSIAELLETASYRFAAYDPAVCLRLIHFSREDLREAFPDPLGGDLAGFRLWLATHLRSEYELPESVARLVESLDPARSLARVVSFVRCSSDLHGRFAASGIDTGILRALLPAASSDAGFTATDLVLVDWWLRGGETAASRTNGHEAASPGWLPAGVRDLLGFARTQDASAALPGRPDASDGFALTEEARATLLDRLVVRSPGDPRFTTYLQGWLDDRALRPRGSVAKRRLAVAAAEVVGRLAEPSPKTFAARASAAISSVRERRLRGELEALFTPDPRGVNVFGYFQSPIGLGAATQGVCRSLEVAGYRHRDVVLTNSTMASDLRLGHLIPDFAFHHPRNFVVSYPHIQCDVFELYPECFFAGRENLGYLAWEQRDLHPLWAGRLQRYDRLFALSSFAASSLENGLGRPVGVLPCVVEVDVERAKGYSRAELGIPENAYAVGFVFDASSSVERKNPLGAVRALVRAFAGRRDVVVVLKITNGDRYPYTRAVDEIVSELAAAGLRSVVVTRLMPRAAVEGLIACLDLYVSLHRAEGFGYTLAEAMLLGVPALATRYSGNLDFMNDENSWLVECRETIVRRAEGPFRLGTVWADPDLEDAAEKLRHVYEDREEAARRAARGRVDVAALLSPEAIARRLAGILDGEPAPVTSASTSRAAGAAAGDPGRG